MPHIAVKGRVKPSRHKLRYNPQFWGRVGGQPLAFLPLLAGAGTSARDVSWQYNGTLSGGAAWSSGTRGTTLSFDGASSTNVTLVNSAGLQPTDLSVSLWFRASAGNGMLASKEDGNATTGWRMLFNSSRKIQISDRGNANTLSSATTLSFDTWYHVAAVWSTSGLRIYINGRLDASNASAYSNTTSSKAILLGNMVTFNPLNGKIDLPIIFGRALTTSQAGVLYYKSMAMFTRRSSRIASTAGGLLLRRRRAAA